MRTSCMHMCVHLASGVNMCLEKNLQTLLTQVYISGFGPNIPSNPRWSYINTNIDFPLSSCFHFRKIYCSSSFCISYIIHLSLYLYMCTSHIHREIYILFYVHLYRDVFEDRGGCGHEQSCRLRPVCFLCVVSTAMPPRIVIHCLYALRGSFSV